MNFKLLVLDSSYETKYELFNSLKFSIDLSLLDLITNISLNPEKV